MLNIWEFDMMNADLVVPAGASDLVNTATGEHYQYRVSDVVTPPKVEMLEVTMPDGTHVKAMCISTQGGFAVYFQGIVH